MIHVGTSRWSFTTRGTDAREIRVVREDEALFSLHSLLSLSRSLACSLALSRNSRARGNATIDFAASKIASGEIPPYRGERPRYFRTEGAFRARHLRPANSSPIASSECRKLREREIDGNLSGA